MSEDTHWKPYNRVYGNFNQFVPSAEAIRQSGNLYDYATGNPLKFIDLMGTEIVLIGTEAEQQIILNELNNLVGNNREGALEGPMIDPILNTRTNENGDVVVYFAQPPNPNFPQSTELVDRLINNEFTTTIVVRPGKGMAASRDNDNANRDGNNFGSGGTVFFDSESRWSTEPRIMTVCPDTGNVRPEIRPNFIGLGHELIHAERYTRGARFNRDITEEHRFQVDRARRGWWIFSWWSYTYDTRNVPVEEWATVGLGFNDDCDITENDLRSEHGLNLRGTY